MKKFIVKFNALRGQDKLTIEADGYTRTAEHFHFYNEGDMDDTRVPKTTAIALIVISSVHYILKDPKDEE